MRAQSIINTWVAAVTGSDIKKRTDDDDDYHGAEEAVEVDEHGRQVLGDTTRCAVWAIILSPPNTWESGAQVIADGFDVNSVWRVPARKKASRRRFLSAFWTKLVGEETEQRPGGSGRRRARAEKDGAGEVCPVATPG